VHFRDILLVFDPNYETVTQAIVSLPSRLSGDQSTEEVIASCLRLMEAYPAFMKDPVVSWAVAPTGLSDYALLQAAKARRNASNDADTSKDTKDSSPPNVLAVAPLEYRQAAIAAGIVKARARPSLTKYALIVSAVAVAVLVSASMTSTSSDNAALPNSVAEIITTRSKASIPVPDVTSSTNKPKRTKKPVVSKTTPKPQKVAAQAKPSSKDAEYESSKNSKNESNSHFKISQSVKAVLEGQKNVTRQEESSAVIKTDSIVTSSKKDASIAVNASIDTETPTLSQESFLGERHEARSPPVSKNINVALKSVGGQSRRANQIGLDLVGPWENFRSHWKDLKEHRNDKNRVDGNDMLRYSIE
jgi:hypothetical protein